VSTVAPSGMPAPLYVYYEVVGFAGPTNRAFVKSRNFDQLRGNADYSLSTCAPLTQGERGKVLYPCGLVANSFFNDSITATVCKRQEGSCMNLTREDWSDDGITWPEEGKLFVDRPLQPFETRRSPNGFLLPPLSSPDLINWMRISPHTRFRKLYRKILSTSLEAGDTVIFTVQQEWAFRGEKAIILATGSLLGAKNGFLGWLYTLSGAVMLFLTLLFGVYHAFWGRLLGSRARSAPPLADDDLDFKPINSGGKTRANASIR